MLTLILPTLLAAASVTDSTTVQRPDLHWSVSALAGWPDGVGFGPEVVARTEVTRWSSTLSPVATLQVGGTHLFGSDRYSKWPIFPVVGVSLGLAF